MTPCLGNIQCLISARFLGGVASIIDKRSISLMKKEENKQN